MKKVIKDNRVAILVSDGFGAGWSTWADSEVEEKALFCPEIVNMILEGKKDEITDELIASLLGENFYTGGLGGLDVEWVEQGAIFKIDEYDGSESLFIFDEENGFKA